MMITKNLVKDDGNPNTELIAKWQAIFNDGLMDLGNHSYSHAIKYSQTDTFTTEELEYDITGSYNLLKKFFPNQEVLVFGPPWGSTKGGSVDEAKKYHYALSKGHTNNPNPATPKNMFLISAETNTSANPLSTLTGWVDNAITGKGWQVILLHGVSIDDSPSTYETLDENVEALFKYIKQKSDAGDVWSGSLNEVVKYIYERDSATVEVLETTAATMKIGLTDTMADNEIFDYPLTVKVNVPSAWPDEVTYTQNGASQTAEIFEESGKKYALVKIIPDGGDATLKVYADYEISGDTVSFSGIGSTGDFSESAPWASEEIKYVEIGEGVSEIGKNSFAGCKLTEIRYAGTYENWKAVDIKEGNDAVLKADVVFADGLKLLANTNGIMENADFLLETRNNSITTEYALSVIGQAVNADRLKVFIVVYNANGKMLGCENLAEDTGYADRIIYTGSMTNEANYKLMVWEYPCNPIVDFVN